MIGVIFDVDGVLLDSMPIWMNAGELYLKSKGLSAEQNLGKKILPMSMEEGAQYIKKTYDLSDSYSEICNGINQVIMEAYEKSIPLKEGVIETLQSLAQKNIPMVIATSSAEHIIRSAFKRLQITKYFEKIFTCTEIGAGKSKPDIFLAAAEYIEINEKNYSDIYVVEDSLTAVQTAKQAGFTVVGIYDKASSDTWEQICQIADYHSQELKSELFTKNI